jgi:hypothetical protein
MPLYDFECPHKHRFDHLCKIAEREEKIPCQGQVNQLADHELDDEAYEEAMANHSLPLPDGLFWVPAIEDEPDGDHLLVRKVPCQLQAGIILCSHNNPGGALGHNTAANRDAAREGRYDPLNPNRNFMVKGRKYLK